MSSKTAILVYASLFALLLPATQDQSSVRFLKIQEPVLSQQAEKHLLVNLDNLYEMIRLDELQDIEGSLEIIHTSGRIVSRLGKVKNGEIKWAFRVVNEGWLMVKFDPEDHQRILENIKSNPGESGYMLQLVNKGIKIPDGRFIIRDADKRYQQKELNYIRFHHLTFSEVPDLAVDMKYPFQVHNGQNLAPDLHVSVRNHGVVPVENVHVDVLLSPRSQLPAPPITVAESYSADLPLLLKRVTLEALAPGENREIRFTEPVEIPQNVPPGKYYMAVVADPEGLLNEYSRLDNSLLGLTMVSFPKLQELRAGLKGARLIFEPESYKLTIECQGAVISDGKDWRKCRMRPYIFQLRHANWPDYHWEVNSVDRGVWEVRGAEFCQTGGKGRELPTRIEVQGGSRFTSPVRVIIPLDDLELKFLGDQGRVKLTTMGSSVEFAPAWRICRMQPTVYRFRSILWPDFFWEFDLFGKTGNRVSGVDFQRDGGQRQPLETSIEIDFAATE